jgi:RimK-like ATP-grasp domain
MTVLIIGAESDAHAAFIHQKIHARGAKACYFNSHRFPAAMRLSLDIPPNSRRNEATPTEFGRMFDPGQNGELGFSLSEIQSVYWRYHMGIALPADCQDPHLRDMAYREIESMIGSLFRMLPCHWVNSPEAIQMHVYKAYQLQLMAKSGIRIPHTLVSNDSDAVIAFYERMQGRVIYKPVRGGAHTARLLPEDLKPDRLAELAKAPVQFQEMIDGVDVRIYWLDGEAFAGEIRATTLDFRDDPQAPIVPIALPDAVRVDCGTIAKQLLLLFSGIDARRTPQGEYVFLEANPCPMFIHFEQRSGYPISDRLVDLLLQ